MGTNSALARMYFRSGVEVDFFIAEEIASSGSRIIDKNFALGRAVRTKPTLRHHAGFFYDCFRAILTSNPAKLLCINATCLICKGQGGVRRLESLDYHAAK